MIDYRKLTTSDNVLDGSDLKDWSTIFLKLEEKFDAGGTRQRPEPVVCQYYFNDGFFKPKKYIAIKIRNQKIKVMGNPEKVSIKRVFSIESE